MSKLAYGLSSGLYSNKLTNISYDFDAKKEIEEVNFYFTFKKLIKKN
jgi:hypothetical protein